MMKYSGHMVISMHYSLYQKLLQISLILHMVCALLLLNACEYSNTSLQPDKNSNPPDKSMTKMSDAFILAPTNLVLTDITAWQSNDYMQDPLIEHQPAEVLCQSWWIEDGLLEVATNDCNYFSVSQVIHVDLKPNSVITAGLIHDALVAFDIPAMAHAAILINDVVIWEKNIMIPNAPQYYKIDMTVRSLDLQIRAGDIITLHLHNHGANQWRWLNLKYTK
jgi:hypothetical protein